MTEYIRDMTTTLLTKQNLQIELEKFEKRIDKKIASKDNLTELEKKMDNRFNALIQKLFEFNENADNKLDEVKEKMDKRHDQIMTSLDFLVKEAETAQEDRVLGTAQLRDHEVRITKLEQGNN